jgi:organic hydroperoxide reductase OsmC/OhrA
MKALYEAQGTAAGGRTGHVSADGGVLDLGLSIPKGLGEPGKCLANPMLALGTTVSTNPELAGKPAAGLDQER